MKKKRNELSPSSWIPVLLLSLVLAPVGGEAATDSEGLAAALEAIVEAAYPADEPGAAVIVVKDGEVLYRGARGMANLELGVPLEPDMVFRLGSVTKQFTAAAILMLEEQGKLSVQDSITKYLPDYPVHGHTITIEHLLTHTSGIFNYTAIPGYMAERVRQDLTTDELIDEFKDQEMSFAPGDQWSYSNSGYVLLGAIIEKVSGMSYPQFIREKIFEPLGMSRSHYGGHQLIAGRVAGYAREGDGYRNAAYLSMTQPHGAGALLSTVSDLARWDQALYGDELLSTSSRKRMFTPYTLNDREATSYAYGFAVGSLRGTPSISHGGGIFGFRTHVLRLPEEGVYVAVLSNGAPVSPNLVATKLAALALGKPFPEWRQTRVSPEILKTYVGVYRIGADTTRTVSFEDGRLYTQRQGSRRQEALPHSETGFFFKESLTHFEIVKDEAGNVSHMLMYQNGNDEPEKALRTNEEVVTRSVAAVDPNLYDHYVGRYQLRQGFLITVTRDGDRLLAQATGQPQFEIFPESETRFFLKAVDAQVTFVPGPGGKAQEMVLHQGGSELKGKRVE